MNLFEDLINKIPNPLSNPVFDSIIEKVIQEHKLVSRVEFDAQTKVLEQTEARVKELEALVTALELKLSSQQS